MTEKPENILKIKKVDITELLNFINSLTTEEWNEWQYRQNTFDTQHQTKTYPLLWSKNQFNLGEIIVSKKNLNSKVWEFLNPILNYLSDRYKAKVVKCMFVNLPSHCNIIEHRDTGSLLIHSHRIHLPIKTNNNVKFFIDGKQYFFEEGFFYEINNQKHHSVENVSEYDRIHLIVDLLPDYKNIKVSYINDQ